MAVATKEPRTVVIDLPIYGKHVIQDEFVDCKAKRIVVKAGRRSGKTKGLARRGVTRFLQGKRVLYAAPTNTQTDAYWYEVKNSLRNAVSTKQFKLNEGERYIERRGTQNRIKAKTAWDADTMRGDYGDDVELDEYQLWNEDAWEDVVEPMLIDNDGNALFCFTPPSLKSGFRNRARDPRHASKLYKKHADENDPDWKCFHFTSWDNPYVSVSGLERAAKDMSLDSYRREIMAEDDEIETSWLVHSRFNESLCKIQRFDIPSNWDIYSGHDFGSANPAALFLAEVKLPLPAGAPAYMRYKDLVVFKEYAPGAGYSSGQHVDRFKEIVGKRKVSRSVGGSHQEDASRGEYSLSGWPISEPPISGARSVSAQLDRVINLEENNRLYVFPDCYQLLSQMSNCLWELDAENKPMNKIKDEVKWHLLAALRYVGSMFQPVTTGDRKVVTVLKFK